MCKSNLIPCYRDAAGGPDLVTYEQNGIVDCDNFRDFWISWDSSAVQVGTGSHVGSKIFMTYNKGTDYDINDVSVLTGWGATGEWNFCGRKFRLVNLVNCW